MAQIKPRKSMTKSVAHRKQAFEEVAQLTPEGQVLQKKQTEEAKQPSRKNNAKKAFATYVDPAVIRQFKTIALEEDKTLQVCVAEAYNLYFKDKNKPEIA